MIEILTPEQILVLAQQIKELLAKESQGVGEVPVVASLDYIFSLPTIERKGDDERVVEAPLTLLRVSLRKAATAIEWRQGDDGEWQTLIPIPDITGPQGETPVFRTGVNGIEWKFQSEPDTAWKELVSIDRLKLTFDMLSDSQKEAIRGYSAYQLWEQEEGNNGKSYQDFKNWMKKEALEAADTATKAAQDTILVKGNTEIVCKETAEVQKVTDKTRICTEAVKTDTWNAKEETERIQTATDRTRIKTDTVKYDTLKVKDETKHIQAVTSETRIKTETVKNDTLKVKEDTEHIQTITDETRIKTETVKYDNQKVQEETKAIQRAINKARIDTETVKIDTLRVKEETEKIQRITDETRIKTETVRNDTLQVKSETITAMEIAKELNAHPGKPIGGYWFFWDLVSKEYVNSGIQAKGDVGSSFRIVGRYDTLDDLKAAVPDGKDIDGVFAVGVEEPYSYYAWLVIDGVWKWDNQGQLRGAQGKSAFEVWLEDPANAGKPISEFYKYLSPYIGENKNWWVRDFDTGIKAPGTDAYSPIIDRTTKNWLVFDDKKQMYVDSGILAEGISVKVQVLKNTPNEYRLKFISAEGEETTPNLQGRSGSAVLDIDHVPDENDTNYTYNDIEYSFSIGDMIRYHDTARNKFTLYICLDLSENKALWQKIGSGTGGMKLISGGTAASRTGVVYKVTGGNAASTGDDDIRTGGTASEIFD